VIDRPGSGKRRSQGGKWYDLWHGCLQVKVRFVMNSTFARLANICRSLLVRGGQSGG
jgi:hypothetical protein